MSGNPFGGGAPPGFVRILTRFVGAIASLVGKVTSRYLTAGPTTTKGELMEQAKAEAEQLTEDSQPSTSGEIRLLTALEGESLRREHMFADEDIDIGPSLGL